ncbi:3beta-hydroxysteroid-dehydrogenase/decarboxylase isoform X2 [Mangifera indica]|uniref:3beta-hydroxysteroid-dehydrogenase/decarboxylase isoform X2 n=1 Tax=Mangifera indica TaxID=29780 RepID=UPI001CFB9DB0|nr:3beta-hydroxysteroid-dehydrogenase/decarboxylase isoform X2 [Mangifera indica]
MMSKDGLFSAIPTTCVVLNGRGFVGRSLVSRLLRLGNWIVRVADSAHSLQLDSSESDSLLADAISSSRAEYRHVDVRDVSQIKRAFEGASVVFFMDSSGLDMSDFYNCYMVIVQGAKNVINACRECRVRRLIYNSTADVVFDGSHDIYNGDESLTCHWKDMMCDLKAQAEALVLLANDIDGLLTCALRPSNVFGPGDKQFVPFLVNLAKYGRAKFILGNGENMSDFTYVENVSHAHICAAEALDSRMVFVDVAGKAFFITNLKPMKFWEFVSLILEGLGYQRPIIRLPIRLVWYIFLLVKWTRHSLGLRSHNHPLSAFYFVQLATHTRTFDCTSAQKHIGYSPIVSQEEGVSSTIESFSHLAKDSPLAHYSDLNEQSKVENLLGGGKVARYQIDRHNKTVPVADILLWRDEKQSFTYFLALVLLFYWFFLSGRTFISSAANLLLLVSIVLFGYGFLPSNIFGLKVPSIPLSSFEVSETPLKNSIATIAFLWNWAILNLRTLAKGDDWKNFIKVLLKLYLAKLILIWSSLTAVIAVALVFSFTAFFIYEQYESELDGLAMLLFNCTKQLKSLLTCNLLAPVASFLCNLRILHKHNTPNVVKDRQ